MNESMSAVAPAVSPRSEVLVEKYRKRNRAAEAAVQARFAPGFETRSAKRFFAFEKEGSRIKSKLVVSNLIYTLWL